MQQIRYEPDTKTVQDLVNLYEKKHLNLNPGFQRDSVWTTTDRKKLIDSILLKNAMQNIITVGFFVWQGKLQNVIKTTFFQIKFLVQTKLSE